MSGPVIEARELTRHYVVSQGLFRAPATLRALERVSFTLDAGRTLAVVGESGCGKSTLARQLTLIEQPTAGRLVVDGADVTDADGAARRALRRRVQMVFQNPFGSLNPRKTVGAILEEPLVVNTRMSARERGERARAMLAKVGLRPEHYGRYPHMFSGGQRQRIAVARALMLEPRVIVADEPVSALDVSVQAQVLNLLLDLQEDTGVAMVFISHDLSVVRFVADDVMVMYLGRAVEQAPADVLFDRPRHPYTRALLSSTPRLERVGVRPEAGARGELPSPLKPPSGCAFRTRCPFATDRCRDEVPELRPVEGSLVACHYAETIPPPA
jgi:dipeptide transport system ATP-binding protein